MSDLRDLSRLPVDQRYWDDLEARIMSDLGPRVRAGAGSGYAWWTPLSARAWTLGGLALAASLAGLLLLPPRQPQAAKRSPTVLESRTADAALVTFVSAAGPPPVASLLLPPRGP